MDSIIRIGLIVVAVAVIIALLVPVVDKVVEALPVVGNLLTDAISQLAPYLTFGRQMFNALVGSPVLVDIILWFVLLSEPTLHAAKFTIKIFRKLVG